MFYLELVFDIFKIELSRKLNVRKVNNTVDIRVSTSKNLFEIIKKATMGTRKN